MIEVFCDLHHVPMELFASQSDRWQFTEFRCTELGCSRHFVERHGYHNVTNERMDISTQNLKHCPTHSGAVAITAIEESTLFWNCTHPDCEAYGPIFEAVQ